jgi:hypothetical protein
MCILCVIIIGFDANGSISAGQSFGRWLSFLTSWTWVLCLFVLFPGLVISLYFLRPSPSSADITATVAAAQPPTGNAAASRQRTALWMRIHWVMWEMAGAVTQAHALTCTQVRVPCSRTGKFSLRHLTPFLNSNPLSNHHNSLLGASVQVGQRRSIFCKTSISPVRTLTVYSFFCPLSCFFFFAHRQSFSQSVGVHGLNAAVRLLTHAASTSPPSTTRFTSPSRSTSLVTLGQCLLSDTLLSGLPVVGSHVVRSPTSLLHSKKLFSTSSGHHGFTFSAADLSCVVRALLRHFQCDLRARYRCSPKLQHSYLDQLRFHRVLYLGLVAHSNMVIHTSWHLHQMHCNTQTCCNCFASITPP